VVADDTIMAIAINSIATGLRGFLTSPLTFLGRRTNEELITNYTHSWQPRARTNRKRLPLTLRGELPLFTSYREGVFSETYIQKHS
jgi:hypothetical protein